MSYYKGAVFLLYGDEIALPHSCDEWIIGGKEEALQMIEDLKEAIEKLPSL